MRYSAAAAAHVWRTIPILPLLGQIPLDPRIQEGGDTGRPIVAAESASAAARALVSIAAKVVTRMNEREKN